jgi:gluconolactonase
VFDAHGGFWFTDHGRTWERVRERGAVFYAKADGSFIERVILDIESPNGIGLSADGSTLYVAETFTGHVWSFHIIAPGKVRTEAAFWTPGGRLVGRAGAGVFLDSLAVDAEGYVCIGTLGKGGILVMAPDGSSSRHIELPDVMVTNLCFGGPDLRTAYITLSQSGRLIAMDWPSPGLQLNYSSTPLT